MNDLCKKACVLFGVGAVLFLSSCSGQQEAEEPHADVLTVGFSQLGNESDWRVANTESMKSTFTEEGGYELLLEDAQQKQEKQIAAIRNFILREVDYIVLAPVVETGWDEVLAEAKDADVPVIIMDRMVDTEDGELYTAWVGSDMREEGEKAVRWLEEFLEEQGRAEEEVSIVHIQGTPGSSAQLGRTYGLEKGLAMHDNWHLAAQVCGEFTQAKAYEVMKEILLETKEMDVVYCENDNEAFGVMQALDEAGISYGEGGDVILISFDATEAGLIACMEGRINLNVECNPLHGPRVEKIIRQLEEGQVPEKESFVEETIFEPEDLTADFIAARGY
ncbi:MAG: ABC transporter substrate-binding protein [Lachnospiraceae bacterium]|nr:ABC transporter substrate-binding protein [Lachnospiraceae bacterium]